MVAVVSDGEEHPEPGPNREMGSADMMSGGGRLLDDVDGVGCEFEDLCSFDVRLAVECEGVIWKRNICFRLIFLAQ